MAMKKQAERVKQTMITRQSGVIRDVKTQVKSVTDWTDEDLFWKMADVGADFVRDRHPMLYTAIVTSPLFWKEFGLWFHSNNSRFMSEISVEDCMAGGTEWVREQFMKCQAGWLRQMYRVSVVVVNEAMMKEKGAHKGHSYGA